MLNSINTADSLIREYEKYDAAGYHLATTSISPGLFEAKKEGFPTFDEEERKPKLIWRHASHVSPEAEVGSISILVESFLDTSAKPQESPFDALEERFRDREKIRQIKKIKQKINAIIDETNIRFSRRLAARLHFLYDAVLEDPDEDPVPIESLVNFIRFLQDTPNLKYPEVVLTPSNEISAQWRTEPNRHFAVVFQMTGETRFVIFTPNSKDSKKTDRLSGITSVDTLMELVEPHGVLDWAVQ